MGPVTEGKWYRTRFLPIMGKKSRLEGLGNQTIDGATGVIMDITQLKAREADLKAQDVEKARLVANEATAKEASRLKSQFLANVRLVPIPKLAPGPRKQNSDEPSERGKLNWLTDVA